VFTKRIYDQHGSVQIEKPAQDCLSGLVR